MTPPVPAPQQSGVSSLSEVRKLRNVLQGVDFFTRLKLEELETLVEHLKKRTVPRGHLIIQQGDKNVDAFYMIASGRCTVWIKKGLSMAKVADLGPENYFGERALITEEPRAATVRAETVSELYVLYKEDFNAILMKNPGIAQELKFHVAQYKR
jgi:CRP-like cAMP-binding protein